MLIELQVLESGYVMDQIFYSHLKLNVFLDEVKLDDAGEPKHFSYNILNSEDIFFKRKRRKRISDEVKLDGGIKRQKRDYDTGIVYGPRPPFVIFDYGPPDPPNQKVVRPLAHRSGVIGAQPSELEFDTPVHVIRSPSKPIIVQRKRWSPTFFYVSVGLAGFIFFTIFVVVTFYFCASLCGVATLCFASKRQQQPQKQPQ